MPTIGERIASRQSTSEQQEYSFQRQTHDLRDHLTRMGITYAGNSGEKCSPVYREEGSFRTAHLLISYFYELNTVGISEAMLCSYLSTDDGVSTLHSIAQEHISRLYPRDREDEMQALLEWMKRDSELCTWLQASEVTTWDNLTHNWPYSKRDLLHNNTLWYQLLKPESPYRSAILNEIKLQMFRRADIRDINLLIQVTQNGMEPDKVVRLIEWIDTEGGSITDWGSRLALLDELGEMTGFSFGSYGNLEHSLAQVYFAEHADSTTEFLPLYLAYGRELAYDTRAQVAFNPLPRQAIERKSYQHVTDQESDFDPRTYLLPLIGIEVEAELTPEIYPRLYALLAHLVVNRGLGGTFEYSADPVRHAETLKLLYEKLFETGFLDLFHTTDYSTHWNANVTNINLYRETLGGLALTGYFTDGRTSANNDLNSITTFLFPNESNSGWYLEWKQGDLYHPEQLMIAIDIFHAVVTAQKNYEKVVAEYLKRRNIPEQAIHSLISFEHPKKNELLKTTNVSREQIELAMIFHDYRQKMRQIFGRVTQLKVATLDNLIDGDSAGMDAIHDVLGEVYPETESLLEHDPTSPVITKKGKEKDKAKVANLIVAQAQAVATETMHRVQKVLAECYENYLKQLLKTAEILAAGVTVENILAAMFQLEPVGKNRQTPRPLTPKDQATDVLERLAYGLRQTAFDNTQLALLNQAHQNVQSFLAEHFTAAQ